MTKEKEIINFPTKERVQYKIQQLVKSKANDIIELAKIGCSQTIIARVLFNKKPDLFFSNELAHDLYEQGIQLGKQLIKQHHYQVALSDDRNKWLAIEKWWRWFGDRPSGHLGYRTPIAEKFENMWTAYDCGEISDEALKNISTALEKHVNVLRLAELDELKTKFAELHKKVDELTKRD
jgi:hypothetical protein